MENAENLDIMMPMYNLIEYSKTIEKQQVVFGIITELIQIILLLFLMIQIVQLIFLITMQIL